MSQMHEVYLAFGTNLGERLDNLRAALRGLPPAVEIEALSAIYETPPWGVTDQPAFLNMVGRGVTALAPLDLLAALKGLEARLGRRPGLRYGPRLIDLDILFYDDAVIAAPGLTIPHPRLAERAFVLKPLAELAPGLRHPLLDGDALTLLAQVDAAKIEYYHPPLPVTGEGD